MIAIAVRWRQPVSHRTVKHKRRNYLNNTQDGAPAYYGLKDSLKASQTEVLYVHLMRIVSPPGDRITLATKGLSEHKE